MNGSSPKTDPWMMEAEFLWKLSKDTEDTVPLILEARALHMSPVKSATENILAASFWSSEVRKCQL